MGQHTAALVLALLATAFILGCTGPKPVPEGMTADGRAYRGAAAPSLVIYEYSDFECPYCERAQPTINEIMNNYQDRVQLQFRHYPLPIHPRAGPSALAAVCAEKQGKFWKLHDLLYAHQSALEDADIKKYAADTGLDMAAFDACIAGNDATSLVSKDMADGVAKGVRATPTFIIGQSTVEGAQGYDKFAQVINSELARGN